MNWYLKVLTQYADFNGRARRKEYWMFTLFNIIAIFLLIGIGFAIAEEQGLFIYGLYVLAIIVPSLAVTVRRLHDIGKSGWWILIQFIPFIGGFWMLFLTVQEGDKGDNEFGADPKKSYNQIKDVGVETL